MAKVCKFVVYSATKRGTQYGGASNERSFPVSNAGWERAVEFGGHTIGLRCTPGPGGDEGSTILIALARSGRVTKPNLTKGDYGYEHQLAGLRGRGARRKNRCKFGVAKTTGKCLKNKRRKS